MDYGSLPKPEAVGGAVEIEVSCPRAVVQINNYHWPQPHEAHYKSDIAIVNMALSRQSAALEGAYLEASSPKLRRVGDILFMAPNYTLHSRWQNGSQRSLCVGFNTFAFDSVPEIDWHDPELFASLDVRSAEVRGLLLKLANEMLTPGFASDLLIDALCVSLAIEFHRYFLHSPGGETEAGGRFTVDQLRRIRERIEDDLEGLRLTDLAIEHGMSNRHFSRLFHNSTGKTLSEYVTERRVAEARVLLGQPDNLIKQIAFACGFKSSSAFCAAFRRETGLTPQQFRASQL
jgi:AraC family transcriptional regulator